MSVFSFFYFVFFFAEEDYGDADYYYYCRVDLDEDGGFFAGEYFEREPNAEDDYCDSCESCASCHVGICFLS